MEASLQITLQMVMTVIAGIGAQVLAEWLKVPSIVFLLLFGILLGSDGLNVLHPNLLGSGLEVIVALSVAVILFEGGLNLELRDLGRVSGSLRNLVTIGTLITLLGGGMAAHWLGEFPWSISFLYASLVVVTGPTVISPLLKQVPVDRRVAALLEGEGVLIDPVGAILAVVVLNIILNEDADLLSVAEGLVFRLGIGVVVGILGGWLLGVIVKLAQFLSDELKNLVVLAGLWGLFGLAQSIRSEAGLMATVVAGLVIRPSSDSEQRLLRRFKGQLTLLAVSVLFILLAADLSLASIVALGWGSLATVLVLMFVVRPINVWVCTWNSGMNWRQKLFLSWIAPRGIVSASVASLFAILLTERGFNGGASIKALVFLTIILTVSLHGLTARWLANWLQLSSQQATGAVIIGCNPLSVLIGRLFRERGESIVLIDTDPESGTLAEQENLPVYISSGLDIDTLEQAGLASAGTFLAMTNNGEVNLVLAQRAAEEFGPPRVLAVFPRDPQASSTGNNRVSQAFIPQLPIKTWNQYLTDRAVKLGETIFREEEMATQQTHLQNLMESGELLPLLVEREGHLQVASTTEEWQPDDRLIYLLHDPKPNLIKLLSGSIQPRLTLEKLPEVEMVTVTSEPEAIAQEEQPEPEPESL
ncbi:sodium:proton antiporter [Leptolyngbya sp. 'hensonii']|uniref:cation:proton antiporter n=1 Tax=Leptolyngbya sp. 'hensonii' TaxID=1922337 RepID=UPI00094F55F3|nr:cation:proton antiporter [Leptolyngbya sp. 'hensonii']OLP16860.1 sodium:proton antiporter [Leptolyngbya sp. 'hensonii']